MALLQDRMKPAEYMRNVFAITPETETEFETLLDPAYWAHVAAKLHPTDRIEVTCEQGTYFAELFVVSCGRNWAKVSVLRFHELTESSPEEAASMDKTEAPKFEVRWKSQKDKFGVLRIADKQWVKDGLPTKAEALTWVANHEKAMQ